MEYTDLAALTDEFKQGKFKIADQITVNGVKFNNLSSSSKNWQDTMNGAPGIIVYSAGKTNRDAAVEAGLDEWLAFIWVAKGNQVIPVEVKPTKQSRMSYKLKENAEPNTIGDVVRIKITSLPSSNELKGRVDTGATVSSLHAEKWELDGDNIKFVSKELSPNVITTKLIDKQAVKSADGGVEYRPVIELNIKINDKQMQNMQFNLNDRGQMEYPILVGQNVLEKGKFLIDPTINEDNKQSVADEDYVDWNALYEEIGTIDVTNVIVEDIIDKEQLHKLYEALKDSNITFADLVKHMRTDITESLDEISY